MHVKRTIPCLFI